MSAGGSGSAASMRPSSNGNKRPKRAAIFTLQNPFTLVVRDGFGLPALYRQIDALDNQIDLVACRNVCPKYDAADPCVQKVSRDGRDPVELGECALRILRS